MHQPVRISLDMDIGKILFTLSYVKDIKQFDFDSLVNGKSIEKKISFNIIRISGSFVSILNPK